MVDILSGVRIEELFSADADRMMASRVAELVRQTLQTADPQITGFLDPAQQEVLRQVLHCTPDVRYVMSGGYRGAERKRAIIMPSYFINEYLDFRIGAVEIIPQSDGEPLSQEDYLRAVLSLGLDRDRFGDIVALDDRGQVFVDAEVQEFVEKALTRVGRYRAAARSIDPDRVDVVPEQVHEIERTVASLRLDSVAAAGYATSRTRMAEQIRARQVKLNWDEVEKPDLQVSCGDVISMRGRGRVVLEEVIGETKKGRFRIRLKKLV
ncbi:MAG: photosystem II S4 domain protein [Firmicutes bacterium]|nr:photosystem II S4 domain protein [Bacillota bacterium]